MTNEELERKIEFIIEHQAQFASDIQQLRETQAQTENLVTRLVNVTFQGFQELNTKIDALVDSHIRLSDKVMALADAQSHTDENLRNLTALLDRHIREGHNGETQH